MKRLSPLILCALLAHTASACTVATRSLGYEAWVVSTKDSGTERMIEKASGVFSKYTYVGIRGKGGKKTGDLYSGVNSAGLFFQAIPTHFYRTKGTPTMRVLLNYASVADVLKDREKLFSHMESFYYILCDRKESAIVELDTEGKIHVASGLKQAEHSNHFRLFKVKHGKASADRVKHAKICLFKARTFDELNKLFYTAPVVKEDNDAFLSARILFDRIEIRTVLNPSTGSKIQKDFVLPIAR